MKAIILNGSPRKNWNLDFDQMDKKERCGYYNS